jgi:hypothetical protein
MSGSTDHSCGGSEVLFAAAAGESNVNFESLSGKLYFLRPLMQTFLSLRARRATMGTGFASINRVCPEGRGVARKKSRERAGISQLASRNRSFVKGGCNYI